MPQSFLVKLGREEVYRHLFALVQNDSHYAIIDFPDGWQNEDYERIQISDLQLLISVGGRQAAIGTVRLLPAGNGTVIMFVDKDALWHRDIPEPGKKLFSDLYLQAKAHFDNLSLTISQRDSQKSMPTQSPNQLLVTLKDELANTEILPVPNHPLEQIRNWAVKATPIIKESYPGSYEAFFKLIPIDTGWEAMESATFFCQSDQSAWEEDREKAFKSREGILNFLDGLLLVSSITNQPPKAYNTQASSTILLVTATPVERQAVFQAFKEIFGYDPQPVSIGDRVYHKLGIVSGINIFLALTETGSNGPGASQQTAEKAIAALRPNAVIMVGIAFGVNENKQKIGDILVSNQILLYDIQRVGTKETIMRGDKAHASPRLINYFQGAEIYWDKSIATVRFGLMLSGSDLVDNIDYRDQLKAFGPEAIGGEMEGGGLYTACLDKGVDWILVKAICDWADGNKFQDKEQRQSLAASHAASFVVHALNRLGWPIIPTPSDESINHTDPNYKYYEVLSKLRDEIPSVRQFDYYHPSSQRWRRVAELTLRKIFSEDSYQIKEYAKIPWRTNDKPDEKEEQDALLDKSWGIAETFLEGILFTK